MAIVGVSNDDVAKNAEFAATCGLSFPLICDTSLAVSVAYGAAESTSDKSAKRMAVLIDYYGNVEQVWPSVDARAFPQDCLKTLRNAPPLPEPCMKDGRMAK